MQTYIPEQFRDEDRRLAQRWINSNLSLDVIIEMYASPEYKRYYQERKKRDRELKEKGIIED